jgi:death-on-curing protein
MSALMYPDEEAVSAIHDGILQRMGERNAGYLFQGGLSYCVETLIDVHNDKEILFEMISWKAAYLIWCLVNNHPFVDGNKRTAFQAADVFLRANGYKIVGVDPLEVVTELAGVAVAQITIADLETWLRKYLRSLTDL